VERFGRGQVIRCWKDSRTDRTVLEAGSDSRADGCALTIV
jgi:hypothetical protein